MIIETHRFEEFLVISKRHPNISKSFSNLGSKCPTRCSVKIIRVPFPHAAARGITLFKNICGCLGVAVQGDGVSRASYIPLVTTSHSILHFQTQIITFLPLIFSVIEAVGYSLCSST